MSLQLCFLGVVGLSLQHFFFFEGGGGVVGLSPHLIWGDIGLSLQLCFLEVVGLSPFLWRVGFF